eukprot:6658206-Pyramimonas_sp.AAC.1
MAGNHWNRFGDIGSVRLRNPELRTRSLARTRSAKLFGVCWAGNHRDRFRDIRRVRLSHVEV